MDSHEAGVNCVDWFFRTKELSADQINEAILVK